MESISIQHLFKSYTSQSTDIVIDHAARISKTRSVLNDVTVDFPLGKINVIVGRSGCGKSTLLSLLSGSTAADSGSILLPDKMRTALLKPDPYVITWTSVFQNVSLAVGAGLQPDARAELAHKLIRLVGLEEFEDLTPAELSTGMKQRLGLARVLGDRAQILLMDEPFAALDFITREEMQNMLLRVQAEMPRTILLVTHQLEEALLLGQRIYVMHGDSTFTVFDLETDPYPRDPMTEHFLALKKEITACCRL